MDNSVFSALADPVRRKIIKLLKNGKMSAGEISKNFDLAKATTSYHLNKLKEADLIRESKFKNFIYYELNMSIFEEIIFFIKQIREG